MLRTGAGRLAKSDLLPTAVRAVLGYYADSGVFDYGSLRLKSRVDDATEAMVAEAFEAVGTEVSDAFDSSVSFEYNTKLVLPAELTLGYLYRRDDCDDERAERMTRLAIEALVDGDMRDAINDDEYEDFEVTVDGVPADEEQRRRAAVLAQEALEARVEEGFDEFPGAVRERYEWAVDISETHQAEDPRFRSLMAAARDEAEPTDDAADLSPQEARERIREEYKHADFADPPAVFTAEERDLPYLKTQYDRVGVIYDGMIEMYREADLPVPDAFKKSIVLAIIGAQVWLDDVDDYRADMQAGQLTPVTAEYLLADEDRDAFEATVDIAEQYLDLAKAHAQAAESTLTGIATEYIYRNGEPEVLPGSH